MSSSETRSAARIATLIALPVAAIAGLIAYLALRPASPESVTSRPTTPVIMTAPKLSAADAVICRAFIAELPPTLRGLPQRPVTAGSEQNAAYGQPPVTVACGASEPTVAATDEVFTMSNVCWYATRTGQSTTWTTLDRRVPVAVTVPPGYQQPGQWANEFSDELVASVPSTASPYC